MNYVLGVGFSGLTSPAPWLIKATTWDLSTSLQALKLTLANLCKARFNLRLRRLQLHVAENTYAVAKPQVS